MKSILSDSEREEIRLMRERQSKAKVEETRQWIKDNTPLASIDKIRIAISFVTGKNVTEKEAEKIIETLELLDQYQGEFSIKLAKQKTNI